MANVTSHFQGRVQNTLVSHLCMSRSSITQHQDRWTQMSAFMSLYYFIVDIMLLCKLYFSPNQVEGWPYIYSFNLWVEPGTVVLTFNTSTQDAKPGEIKANLVFIVSCRTPGTTGRHCQKKGGVMQRWLTSKEHWLFLNRTWTGFPALTC